MSADRLGDDTDAAPGHVMATIDHPSCAESEFDVYAIVRAGGRQEKVSVGDVLVIDKVSAQAGETVDLTPLLLVDGESVTTDADALGKVSVTAEVVDETKGPKIVIQKYKNKTGYKKRQGHRQQLTRVKITAIDA